MQEESFLGRGIKFPPQINQATGRFVLSEGEANVKESLYIILMTQKTERFTRPDFGSRILSYTFMDTSQTMLHMLSGELKETILEQEPRISDVEVTIQKKLDQGCLIIEISYTVIRTNTRDNYVFPFYLYTMTEGAWDGEKDL